MTEQRRCELDAFYKRVSQGVDAEAFRAIKTYFERLSDEEYAQIRQQMYDIHQQSYGGKPMTEKQYVELSEQARRAFQVNAVNSAMNNVPISFYGAQDNAKLLHDLSQTSPSDTIRLTKAGDMKIRDLWEVGNEDRVSAMGITIPSDIFYAGTVPLLDCNIEVDERSDGGVICKCRIVVYEDYAERIQNEPDGHAVRVGAAIMDFENGASLIEEIIVAHGVDSIATHPMRGYRNMGDTLRKHISSNVTHLECSKMFAGYLETWYGIQIALLHPIVKDVFQKSKNVPISRTKSRVSKRRYIVKYIKQHIIDADELDEAIYGKPTSGCTIKRKALVWYVIGHWRTYQDGRKAFVKPYWKGALRDIKMNLEDRERQIAQMS